MAGPATRIAVLVRGVVPLLGFSGGSLMSGDRFLGSATGTSEGMTRPLVHTRLAPAVLILAVIKLPATRP